jgi:hypothetical protein
VRDEELTSSCNLSSDKKGQGEPNITLDFCFHFRISHGTAKTFFSPSDEPAKSRTTSRQSRVMAEGTQTYPFDMIIANIKTISEYKFLRSRPPIGFNSFRSLHSRSKEKAKKKLFLSAPRSCLFLAQNNMSLAFLASRAYKWMGGGREERKRFMMRERERGADSEEKLALERRRRRLFKSQSSRASRHLRNIFAFLLCASKA